MITALELAHKALSRPSTDADFKKDAAVHRELTDSGHSDDWHGTKFIRNRVPELHEFWS